MTSTNPAPEKGAVSAENAAASAEDLAVRTGASPELMANSIGEYVRIWLKQIRSGESGALANEIVLIDVALCAGIGLDSSERHRGTALRIDSGFP